MALPEILDEFAGGREWLVFEYESPELNDSVTEPFLYRHGTIHHDEEKALADLEWKRKHYSDIGRVFVLLVRGVSPWREYEPFNPKAE